MGQQASVINEGDASHGIAATIGRWAGPIVGAALAWYGDEENAKKSIGFAIMHDPGIIDAHRWIAVLHAKAGAVAYEGDARAEAERLWATIPQGARPKDMPFGPAAFAAKHGIDPV